MFTCVLNKNININISDLQWQRFIEDTGTKEIIDTDLEGGIISSLTRTKNIISGLLIITDARKSYTGYYWVGTASFSVCNAHLTALTSMYVCRYVCGKKFIIIYVRMYVHDLICKNQHFRICFIHHCVLMLKLCCITL